MLFRKINFRMHLMGIFAVTLCFFSFDMETYANNMVSEAEYSNAYNLLFNAVSASGATRKAKDNYTFDRSFRSYRRSLLDEGMYANPAEAWVIIPGENKDGRIEQLKIGAGTSEQGRFLGIHRNTDQGESTTGIEMTYHAKGDSSFRKTEAHASGGRVESCSESDALSVLKESTFKPGVRPSRRMQESTHRNVRKIGKVLSRLSHSDATNLVTKVARRLDSPRLSKESQRAIKTIMSRIPEQKGAAFQVVSNIIKK